MEKMNDYTLEDVSFTNHIFERFVERMMNKTGNEAKQYIVQNEQFIKEKLLMLYNSATLLWSGKIREHNFTHFYINRDGWVIVVDKDGKKLITVYKIDLEIDTEFNKMYIEKIKEKILQFNKDLEEKELAMNILKEENNKIIAELQQENSDFKDKIDYNTTKIESLKQETDLAFKEYGILEKELHHKIEKFINAKIF
jgi:hypothetical protein